MEGRGDGGHGLPLCTGLSVDGMWHSALWVRFKSILLLEAASCLACVLCELNPHLEETLSLCWAVH